MCTAAVCGGLLLWLGSLRSEVAALRREHVEQSKLVVELLGRVDKAAGHGAPEPRTIVIPVTGSGNQAADGRGAGLLRGSSQSGALPSSDGERRRAAADVALVPKTRPALPVVPPYLAIFERENRTEGDLWRDDGMGGSDGVMHWRALSVSRPRAVYVENFVSPAEREAILAIAKQKIRPSTVVAQSGDARSSVRTSQGMFITDPAHRNIPAVAATRQRTSLLAGLPEMNVEAMQVLLYEEGQRYLAHPDYFQRMFKNHLSRGGQRVATIIFWLAHTGGGGNTSFPMTASYRNEMLQVAPRDGDAILFYSCGKDPDSDGLCPEDPFSQHQGNPPTNGGIKWVGVYWMRQREFI